MQAWNSPSFDVIVIGSGPGGAGIAAELSEQGKKVLILEWGSGDEIKGTMQQCVKFALIPSQGLYFTPELLALVRGIVMGGSSILAYATAFEPNYAIFEKHGIDLKPAVDQVKADIPIAPLDDRLIGPATHRIQASARDLGYPWEKLPKMINQDKCRPNCDKCTMGCPYGAKWTARETINQACDHGAVLQTGAKVSRLNVQHNAVTGVEFSLHGEAHTITAPLIILAAGGIGTPLILQASGISNAGTDFFFDPLVVVIGSLNDLDSGREFPMAAGYRAEDEGYIMTDLIWPNWVREIFTMRAGRLDRLTGHQKMAGVMIKISDNLGGKLTRFGLANKRLTESDRQHMKRGMDAARKILEHAGAYNIYSTGFTATHPGGTAKIGEVVDSNLKTAYDNLYICDASVIPESWGLPPTLTVLALAKRLGKHLQ
jgi:choline dehydrogenase-like flavoprotein